MIFLIGIFLTGLIALAAWAAGQTAPGETGPRTPGGRRPRPRVLAGYAALAAGLALLLFRPDEEIETGEDAAAYFNAALSLAQRQRMLFSDPALVELYPEERPLFRYGHPAFLQTKDAVLWANDPDWSRVGPHFLPAYSIILSIPATLGFTYAAFWTSPLFAILVGGLLARLAFWLTGKRLAGWTAFFLFILNPAVIWNARCLRAEWPAAFLLLAGLTVWLARNVKRIEISPGPAFLAGLALSAAGWFHILSFYALIPTVLVSLRVTRRSAFWKYWWAGLLPGVGLFFAQIIWIADPYGLKIVWADPTAREFVLSASGLVLVAVLGSRWLSRRARRRPRPGGFEPGRAVGALLSLEYLLLTLLILRYRGDRGMIPRLPHWAGAYHSLTDFGGSE